MSSAGTKVMKVTVNKSAKKLATLTFW